MRHWIALAVGVFVLSGPAFHARALGPDNLLLVTNKNVPEGRALAEFYAAKRHVAADRIVELDLPPGEEISADAYDSVVVPGVRAALDGGNLGERVSCLVTFYGLPLRVAGRKPAASVQAGEDAAFDSELALVRWNGYVRRGWIENPLRHGVPAAMREKLPRVLMTMRLDGPTPELVRELIVSSLKAEEEGLQGKVVVDAGGNLGLDRKNPNYAAFDRTLQDLAAIVRTRTTLPLVLDEQQAVLPAKSAADVAIYCGWYSLQNYVPACTFVPGAVGYHIASYELTTLKAGNQWARGLLTDGVAGTLGAVNEPFLSAFPRPDEFFPLLFTGKLTLAEVYWKTNPMVSWRIAMIGDPLYAPFKSRPAMGVEGLPERLRGAAGPEGVRESAFRGPGNLGGAGASMYSGPRGGGYVAYTAVGLLGNLRRGRV
jgi:uncharacterized protein (TIGR03790 family)